MLALGVDQIFEFYPCDEKINHPLWKSPLTKNIVREFNGPHCSNVTPLRATVAGFA